MVRIQKFKRLAEVIEGVKFTDGIRVEEECDCLNNKKDAA